MIVIINKNIALKNRLMRAMAIAAILIMCTLLLSSCTSENTSESNNQSESQNTNKSNSSISRFFAEYDANNNEDSSWNSSETTNILLKGNSITLDGTGAAVEGSTVTILSGGTYSINGTLNDGQIIVNTVDKQVVKLVLNEADISCSYSAPIYVLKAEKAIIILAGGTDNRITDGDSYVYLLEDSQSDEPDAAIFSKCDLIINNSGSLTVDANYKDGITSKDKLIITVANITVNSIADGIRGRDCIAARDANITVNAKGDGLKSNNDEDAEKGFIILENNTIDITAGEDGVQAETNLLINGGKMTISSGGGSGDSVSSFPTDNRMLNNFNNDDSDSVSTKGIKAGVDLTIEGGTFNIDSADDSIHSNDSLTINGGDITVSSGDDGIHADYTLAINGGDINITQSYEGIESAVITLNDGNLHIVSSDDGINVAGGNDNSGMGGRPGQDAFNTSSNQYLNINGGYIAVEARGDGIDVNGPVIMTDGVVIVNGPTSDGNGALDYTGSFQVTGGYLVAAGSAGMAQAPDQSSTQNSVIINFTSAMAAGTIVHIENDKGEEVLTFAPTKQFQNLVLCSAELETGATYNIYYGGSSTGTVKDSLYSGGTYTPGTKYESFAISDMVSSVGSYTNNRMGGGGGVQPGGRTKDRRAPGQ